MAEERVFRRLAAILAADVAGYSRLMEADEESTLASLTAHIAEFIAPCIADHRGRIVKTTGDGILAEFASVVDAVRCAVAWQTGMKAREAATPEPRRLMFRIGVNLGDVIVRDGDVYGDGVNIAARLESLADPGGIRISGTVYDHVDGKIGAMFADLGERTVRNIDRPIRVYSVNAADGVGDARSPKPRKFRGAFVAATALSLAIAGAAIVWLQSRPGEISAAPPDAISVVSNERPSIAVLPFTNMSDDPTRRYFAEGIAEDIIIALSKYSGLLVIARNSSFAFKSTARDVGEISRALGVRYLLAGSVRRDRNRIRVIVKLIDASTAAHVWADSFDRRIEDVFAVQDEITARIITTLVTEVTRAEIERMRRKPPATLDAYDNYLRGLELFRARSTRPPWGKTLSDSRMYLERALRQDPKFGLAWSTLSENYVSAWIQQPHYGPLQREHQNPDTLAKALASVQKAIEADPGLAEGYAKMGWVLHWMRRPEEAQGAYRRALEINPNLLDDAYPNALIKFGRHAEAIGYLERQIRVDPAFGRNYGNLGLAQYMLRDYGKAADSLSSCKRLAAGWRACNIWMAAVLAQTGRDAAARAEAALVLRKDSGFSVRRYVGFEPYSRRKDADHLSDGLIKAGFPF